MSRRIIMYYPILHNFLKEQATDKPFTAFSIYHIIYIAIVVLLPILTILLFRKKEQAVKEKVIKTFAAIPFALYMLDFMIMPFSYGYIDADKLPFHSCTLLSILIFVACNGKFLRKFRVNFAMIAIFSDLMYVAYPSGVIDGNPLSYRVNQTLLFHSLMIVSGIIILAFDEEGPRFKKCYRDPIILTCMSIWALIGNALYSTESACECCGYNRSFNWFFVKADPLGIFSEPTSHYIMPWLNIIVFFILGLIIYGIFALIRHSKKKKA